MNDLRFLAVRGFMKSGTNWLAALLNRHPAIECRGEYHWQEIFQPLLNRRGTSVFRDPADFDFAVGAFRDMVRSCLRQRASRGVLYAGDRTPHSLAPLIIPEAWHVSMIRDGRDVLVSRVFHLFNNPDVTRMFQRNADLKRSLAEFQRDPWFFRREPNRLLENEELVRVSATWWREHLESDRQTVAEHPELKIRFVRYEDLHARTDELCNDLYRFLELDPAFAEPLEGNLTAGFGEERPDQFLRKGAVGDWTNYFNDHSRRWFNESAGEELIRQGYAENVNW